MAIIILPVAYVSACLITLPILIPHTQKIYRNWDIDDRYCQIATPTKEASIRITFILRDKNTAGRDPSCPLCFGQMHFFLFAS